jgi:predicted pyridoxine 5'-phosphate oxidase superfamily flavin-nucleotide-binding protein
MAEPMTTLSPELQQFLQSANMVLVTTLDAETKGPTNNLITWVLAKDERTVRLAADARGRLMNNIRADGRVLLTVMTAGSVWSIQGTARVTVENLEGPSLKLAMAEVAVERVYDIMFWGGQLAQEPAARVTYDPALKEKLDTAVFGALRA